MRPVPDTVAAVVFDLDGTLVDSYAAISESLDHARAGWGLPPVPLDDVRRSVGRGLESLIAEWVGPDRVEAGVARFRQRYADVFATRTVALPGARSALDALRSRGVRIAVASNKPAKFSRPILASLGLGEFVDVVHGPDTVGATKPDPAMIATCLDELDVDPERAVYVGDMVLDVESGRRAGVAVILVRGGSSPDADLEATGCTVVDALDDLPGRLASESSARVRSGEPS